MSTYTIESNMEQETLFGTETTESDTTTHNTSTTIQVLNRYIVSTISSGLLVVDQQRAHERILYERFISRTAKECISQQIMFPIQCSFSAADAEIISEIMPELKDMGFEMNPLGNTVFVITAIPAEISDGEVQNMLDEMVEDYKNSLMQKFNDKEQSIALSMAKQLAIKKGTKLKPEEMQNIIAQLFSCKIPNTSPFGKKTMIIMKDNELTEKFK
jgi:DNA mismatch repair protein MutL